ncbi:hypothetical protein SIIN_7025_T [Serendipita indica DSM 11827]|uniref:Uncharacterized protein n=1 Tax=Serendipita indica (strain DSM 11827) TaxID=1109443 RepID=G4U056_SERID|nr:hypothetical protein SIIN_7025_T [Serendipita indica DSM 11827]CCA76949.1 hypothetical protein PIIN_10932 [Serendipita indica DSM 11827]
MKKLMMEYHHHQPSCLSMYQTRDGDDKRAAAAKAEAQKQEERQMEKE